MIWTFLSLAYRKMDGLRWPAKISIARKLHCTKVRDKNAAAFQELRGMNRAHGYSRGSTAECDWQKGRNAFAYHYGGCRRRHTILKRTLEYLLLSLRRVAIQIICTVCSETAMVPRFEPPSWHHRLIIGLLTNARGEEKRVKCRQHKTQNKYIYISICHAASTSNIFFEDPPQFVCSAADNEGRAVHTRGG